MGKINSKRKGAEAERDEKGRFKKGENCYKVKNGMLYCYRNEELLFYTDKKNRKMLEKYIWGKHADGYCAAWIEGKQLSLHRYLKKPLDSQLVDHINRHKKDNRLCNLRVGNKSLNALNSKIHANNTSGAKGVWFRKDTNKWAAEIKINHKKISLGCFADKKDAIKARKAAEAKYFKKAAKNEQKNK